MPNQPANGHLSNRVHQATGMVSAQAGCDLVEALERLRLRARALSQSLDATALEVLEGTIRFDE